MKEKTYNLPIRYCGHYHTDKVKNRIKFMFNDIEEFSKELRMDDKKTMIK